MSAALFAELERDFGVHFTERPRGLLAQDAQPPPVTVTNAGLPVFLGQWIDPRLIEVITAPMNAVRIFGETKKGDWTTRVATFPMVEAHGDVSSYGDWNDNGSSGTNVQWPSRQSYHYQTIAQWGEKQLAEAGLAGMDWMSKQNIAAQLVLNKFQNKTYFFGVRGLQNYGILNDPSLPAPIMPGDKVAGGTQWGNATPLEIYRDVQALFNKLVAQSGENVQKDTRMVLATSGQAAVYLSNKNEFGLSVYDMLKGPFPNMRFATAPEYETLAGTVAQLIAEEVDGQEVGFCAFTEKLRDHPIISEMSAFKQKKSQGTWGAVIFLPLAIAQMLDV